MTDATTTLATRNATEITGSLSTPRLDRVLTLSARRPSVAEHRARSGLRNMVVMTGAQDGRAASSTPSARHPVRPSNPAVTISLAATGRFPWREVGPYIAAQLLGSVLGGLLVVAAFGRIAVELGSVGGVAFGSGVSYPQAILVEAVATYLLVLAIMGTAVDRRAPAGWAGLVIGLSVTCLIVVFGPLTGAAVNPARAFGPNAAASFFGGSVAWSQFPAYVVGPLLGGLAAVFSYDVIARPRDAEDPDTKGTDEPPQGTQGDIVSSRL